MFHFTYFQSNVVLSCTNNYNYHKLFETDRSVACSFKFHIRSHNLYPTFLTIHIVYVQIIFKPIPQFTLPSRMFHVSCTSSRIP